MVKGTSGRAARSSVFCQVFIGLEGFLDRVEGLWPFLTRRYDLRSGDLIGEDETSLEGGFVHHSCQTNLMIIEGTLVFESCFVVLEYNSSSRCIGW